jgi:hypothetical protein
MIDRGDGVIGNALVCFILCFFSSSQRATIFMFRLAEVSLYFWQILDHALSPLVYLAWRSSGMSVQ